MNEYDEIYNNPKLWEMIWIDDNGNEQHEYFRTGIGMCVYQEEHNIEHGKCYMLGKYMHSF